MLAQIITENGQKKIKPLTADAGAGNPVGTIIPMYKKSNPSGYLYCDGSTFDETKYPLLYAYLGSNVLPDYREFSLVGAEENTTDVYNASTNPTGTIHAHDVYTEGQAKDDQLQDHSHKILHSGAERSAENVMTAAGGNYGSLAMGQVGGTGNTLSVVGVNTGRKGDVTRGKRKAVFFYIKATSGLSENAQDDVANIINGQRSYSTSEVNTGKKWIDGKPIYRKVVNIGNLPNNVSKTVAHNIQNIEIAIKAEVIAKNSNNNILLTATYGGTACTCFVNNTNIQVGTNQDMTSYSGYVILEYTKTTD